MLRVAEVADGEPDIGRQHSEVGSVWIEERRRRNEMFQMGP